jgi:hypothetical protein
MNIAGYPETRRRIAERVSREQETPTPWENIVMTVGAGGALSLSFSPWLIPATRYWSTPRHSLRITTTFRCTAAYSKSYRAGKISI